MVTIDNLSLEITRKCNMKCRHCLRGDAQNKSMERDVIRAILTHSKYINMITFAGGEPTLAIQVIKDFLIELAWSDCRIGNFYIVTNAKTFSQEMCDVVERLHGACVDNEISGIAFSDDEYHAEWRTKPLTQVLYQYETDLLWKKGLPEDVFRPNDKKHDRSFSIDGIFARGRAKEWGGKKKEYLDCVRFSDALEKNTIVGEMYVTYNGNVLGDCNMPYVDIDNPKYIRGNVLEWDDLVSSLTKSGMDNYNWCKQHCSSFEGCDEWEEYKESLKQIEEEN